MNVNRAIKVLDEYVSDFVLKTGTKKDPNKVTFGDLSRGCCFEDVCDYDSLAYYVSRDANMRVLQATSISIACSDRHSVNEGEIYARKLKLYQDLVIAEYEFSPDLYMNIVKTMPHGCGGHASFLKDAQEGIFYVAGWRIKLKVKA